MNIEWLQSLPEAKLREEILIPLFRAMGFRDVVHYHGGSLEQGKDIVMWKCGELEERVNYAVVVVAERVSGQATGGGSAAKVATQIQQAVSAPFRDATSGTDEIVERVWVVSSYDIRKEAQESIENIIEQSRLHLITSYISGDKLCELVVKHLPAAGAFIQLQTALDHFQSSDPHYGLGMLISKGKKQFWLEPKKDSSGSCPPALKFLIKCDDSNEAKKIQADVEKHIKAGEPLVIPGKYISPGEMPELLKPFFQNITSFAVTPQPAKGRLLVRIELYESADSAPYVLQNIELTQVKGSADEIVLNNNDSIIPWKFELVLQPKKSLANFSFQLQIDGLAANKQLEGYDLTRALSRANRIRVVDAMTSFEIFDRPFADEDSKPDEADPLLLKVLKMLATLESFLKRKFLLPETAEEPLLRQIEYTYLAVTTGKVILQPGKAEFEGEKGFAEVALKAFQQREPITFAIAGREPEKITLLGNEVDLGCPISQHKNIILDADCAAILEAANEHRKRSDEPVSVKVVPFDKDAEHIVYYPKWIKDHSLSDDLQELLKRL